MVVFLSSALGPQSRGLGAILAGVLAAGAHSARRIALYTASQCEEISSMARAVV